VKKMLHCVQHDKGVRDAHPQLARVCSAGKKRDVTSALPLFHPVSNLTSLKNERTPFTSRHCEERSNLRTMQISEDEFVKERPI